MHICSTLDAICVYCIVGLIDYHACTVVDIKPRYESRISSSIPSLFQFRFDKTKNNFVSLVNPYSEPHLSFIHKYHCWIYQWGYSIRPFHFCLMVPLVTLHSLRKGLLRLHSWITIIHFMKHGQHGCHMLLWTLWYQISKIYITPSL